MHSESSFKSIFVLCFFLMGSYVFSQNGVDTLTMQMRNATRDNQDPINVQDDKKHFEENRKTKKISIDFIGYVKLIGGVDFGNIQNTSEFYPSRIPIYPTLREEKPRSFLDARQTRIGIDAKYKVSETNNMHMYVEIDFYNTEAETSLVPHLRHAYAEYKGFLLGQTWSTMKNVAAFPILVDFEGPNSIPGPRNPMIRYTHDINKQYSFGVALETRNGDYTPFAANMVDLMTFYYVPDLIGFIQKDGKWGNLRLNGIVRNMSFTNSTSDAIKSLYGGGAEISGKFNFYDRNGVNDDIRFGYTYGRGIAHYINDLRGSGLDAAPNKDGEMTAVPVMGGYAAYKHAWNKTSRSSAVFSFTSIDNSEYDDEKMYDFSSYGAINFIQSPLDRFDYGIEFIYGKNENKLGHNGVGYRVQLMATYHF